MTKKNDLDELFTKCADMNKTDPGIFLKLGFCLVTLEQVKTIVQMMGRPLVDIGDGLTLLHLGAQFGRCDLVEYLAGECKHPLECRTAFGETPLDQAAWKGHVEAALILIKYGADVDCQTDNKYTPLHRCAYYDHPRLASLLCLAGANQKLRDENNQTAYEVAVENENREVAEILKPLITKDGEDLTGTAYATNNPKHPNFRPEARKALFSLFAIESSLASSGISSDDDDDDDDSDTEEVQGKEKEKQQKMEPTKTKTDGEKVKTKKTAERSPKKRTRSDEQKDDEEKDGGDDNVEHKKVRTPTKKTK
eukprot:TRINITY_DN1839_c0_g1_i1.p1 TRINITY_DN1839_c0_g1~~TRINITY_DN1839_c0_g1_i1.p1  ORF type:complete len:308 (-),score=80.58 TRINITY_DN1839_c0_g1_i1:49-972(-)